MIEINSVTKKFKSSGKEFHALDSVNFGIKRGEIFGLLGPNGAGKTTLINILTGLLVPDEGTVRIMGKDVTRHRNDVLERMNAVSGDSKFHWLLTSKEILRFYFSAYNIPKEKREEKTRSLAGMFEIEGIMNKKFAWLSTGERMRLILAKSLINDPEVLLLDEPTLGLDPDIAIKTRKLILDVNRRYGTTILLTSHYMKEVEEMCGRIAFIHRGRIIDIGKIKDIKRRTKKKTLEEYFVEMVKK
ncbi:MAG: ABC transporter ATP-binding protein [Candidatus Aenigmarchaeota archaeon]|nr:ABC transporter ATP-binding protein [Candidatus Aenigmarchaeota archaeon]